MLTLPVKWQLATKNTTIIHVLRVCVWFANKIIFLQKIRWVIRSHDTFLTIYVMAIYVWKVNKSKTGHCRPQYTLLALKIMRAYKNISQAWVYYIIVLIYLGAWRYALLPMLDISFDAKTEMWNTLSCVKLFM